MSAVGWAGLGVLGAGGAVARVVVAEALAVRLAGGVVGAIAAINVAGAFALGLLDGLGVAGDLRLVLGTGTLGAFTTFSTWMLDARITRGARGRAMVLGGVLAAGVLAAWAGNVLGDAV